jgi:hypothetical protein
VRCTNPVAVGDRGQSLDVRAEHLFEGAGLGFAQLGELGGNVSHRAVMLADLDTLHAGDRIDLRRCSVAIGGQRSGKGVGAGGRGRIAVDRRTQGVGE